MQRNITSNEKFEAMLVWLAANKQKLGGSYHDAYSVVRCLMYINSEIGQGHIRADCTKYHSDNGLSYFHETHCIDIPIHLRVKAEDTIRGLTALVLQFSYFYEELPSDAERLTFFGKLYGNCIEGRTGAALEYGAIICEKTVKPFDQLMRKYQEEAVEILKENGVAPLLTSMVEAICMMHEGEKCANVYGLCDSGEITRENIKTFLEYASLDDDIDHEVEDDKLVVIDELENPAPQVAHIKIAVNTIFRMIPEALQKYKDDTYLPALLNVFIENFNMIRAAEAVNQDNHVRYLMLNSLQYDQAEKVLVPLIASIVDQLLFLDPANTAWVAADDLIEVLTLMIEKIRDVKLLAQVSHFSNEDQIHGVNLLQALRDALMESNTNNKLLQYKKNVIPADGINFQQAVHMLKIQIAGYRRDFENAKSARLVEKAEAFLQSVQTTHQAGVELTGITEAKLKHDVLKTAALLSNGVWWVPNSQVVAEYCSMAGPFRFFSRQPVRSCMLEFIDVFKKKI
jgi:hypothetical protein